MPVISKQQFYVDAIIKYVDRIIKYSSKTGMFSAELPAAVIERLILKKSYVEAETETKCGLLWEEKIKEFNEAKREVTKVILFKIQLNGIIPPEGNPDYHVADYNADLFQLYKCDVDHFRKHILGMTIQWGVYDRIFYKEKIDLKVDRDYLFGDRRRPNGFWDEHRIEDGVASGKIRSIPFTEERAQQFANLQLSFEKLLLFVQEKLYNLNNEELLHLVDNSGIKLLGN